MEITITHCRYTPKWETLEQVIREATNDESSTLVRINRPDGSCDYRAPGIYELDVRRDNQTILPVKLTVVGVGQRQCNDCGKPTTGHYPGDRSLPMCDECTDERAEDAINVAGV